MIEPLSSKSDFIKKLFHPHVVYEFVRVAFSSTPFPRCKKLRTRCKPMARQTKVAAHDAPCCKVFPPCGRPGSVSWWQLQAQHEWHHFWTCRWKKCIWPGQVSVLHLCFMVWKLIYVRTTCGLLVFGQKTLSGTIGEFWWDCKRNCRNYWESHQEL